MVAAANLHPNYGGASEPASQPVGLLWWPAKEPMINPGFLTQIFAASVDPGPDHLFLHSPA